MAVKQNNKDKIAAVHSLAQSAMAYSNAYNKCECNAVDAYEACVTACADFLGLEPADVEDTGPQMIDIDMSRIKTMVSNLTGAIDDCLVA